MLILGANQDPIKIIRPSRTNSTGCSVEIVLRRVHPEKKEVIFDWGVLLIFWVLRSGLEGGSPLRIDFSAKFK